MTQPLPAFVLPYGHGIYAVDTGYRRDRYDAAYLIVEAGRAAFIDCGTHLSAPRLLGALRALGLTREAVDYLIPTHVHLDHAGGAGTLMRELPQARLLVHPLGARHMIDPSALWQGALAIYGAEKMRREFGEVVPVPAERVATTAEGMTISLAGRELRFADCPGHARHHHCIWDAATQAWFCGDAFGASYRELDNASGAWILPACTPVQFDPDAMRRSILRLLACAPECMYLTHFGRVADVPRLGALLLGLLDEMVALGRSLRHAPDRHAALELGLLEIFARSLAAHGCEFDRRRIGQMLAGDLDLNAQGMAVWLDRA